MAPPLANSLKLVAGKLLLLLLFTAGPSLFAGNSASGKSNFEHPFRVIGGGSDRHPNQSITGRLPLPWADDSVWADIEVEYGPMTENPGEGETSLRMHVQRLGEGARGQLSWRDFPLERGYETRIRFLAKSPDYTPIRLFVSQKSPPYTALWTRSISLSAEWQDIESVIPPIFDDKDTQFLFVLEQPGIVDFDRFSFERVPSAEVVLSDERKSNLLPSSSFPLGIATPWIAHMFTDVGVKREESGPSGAPPLALSIRPQIGLSSFEQSLKVAILADPGERILVRVPVDLREGQADMSIRLGPPHERIWQAPFSRNVNLRPGWNTYEHIVELPLSVTGYYLLQIAFEGDADILIDGLQVAVEGFAERFHRTGPIELAMKAQQTYGLSLPDEPMDVQLTAWGDFSSADSISLTLFDMYGNSFALPTVDLPEDPYQVLEFRVDREDLDKPYGTFRLEAQAVDSAGDPVGLSAEILLHRVREPRFMGEMAPESAFGMHYRTHHLNDQEVSAVKRLGFNWLRLFTTFTWQRLERQQGQFDFERSDRDLDIMQEHNIIPLAILGTGAPAWAARDRDPNFRGWACWTPRSVEDWESFVETVFNRYGDRVHYYEVWNEPYYPGFFTDRVEGNQRIIGSAEDYLALQKATYQLAQASRHPLVIGWNTNTMEEMDRHLELLDLEILAYTDFIGIHQYVAQPNPGPALLRQIERLRESLGPLANEIPIWNTEGGHGPSALYNLYQNAPPRQDLEFHLVHAQWYCMYFLDSLAAGVERFFPYVMGAPNFWRNDYFISHVDGQISPVLMAMSALAWQIDGLTFRKRHDFSDGSVMQVFSDGERSVAVVRPNAQIIYQPLPAVDAINYYDMFGNVIDESKAPGRYLFYAVTKGSYQSLFNQLLNHYQSP